MSARGNLLLVVTADIDPALDHEFDAWYEREHLPEITACPGFISGRRIVSPDRDQRPRLVTVYEVEGKHVMETPELKAVSGWGPFADQVSGYRRYWFEPYGDVFRDGAPEAGDE